MLSDTESVERRDGDDVREVTLFKSQLFSCRCSSFF